MWRRRSCLPPRSSEFRVVCKVLIESKASPRICLRSTTPQQTPDPSPSSIATLLSPLDVPQQQPLPTSPCSAKRQTSLVQSLGFSNHGFLNPNRIDDNPPSNNTHCVYYPPKTLDSHKITPTTPSICPPQDAAVRATRSPNTNKRRPTSPLRRARREEFVCTAVV